MIVVPEAAKPLLKNLLRTTYPFGVPFIINRLELPFILNRRGLLGEGVEVGVQYGFFSEHILKNWTGRRLYSVDLWKAFPKERYKDISNVSQEEQDRIYDEARARLAPFGERSKIMRLPSLEAVKEFKNGQMDFVYIDAMHTYEDVLEDLQAWHPKVHPGGILCGHDYLNGEIEGSVYGVKRAVDEFAARHGYRVRVSLGEPVFKSWFIFL